MQEEKRKFIEKCNKKDREKLSGKRKMSPEDFERFIFLTQYLRYSEYEKELWKTFSSNFTDRFSEQIEFFEEAEYEIEKRERWIREFMAESE